MTEQGIEQLRSQHRVYAAMSSLARHIEFVERKAPKFMIDEETRLLTNHFSNLTPQEKLEVKNRWQNFHNKRQASIEIDAEIINERMKTEVLSIN